MVYVTCRPKSVGSPCKREGHRYEYGGDTPSEYQGRPEEFVAQGLVPTNL